jgi:F0F1-type ATP synthase membrane subunit c/vacuolar-type H+-ATPase subunit K
MCSYFIMIFFNGFIICVDSYEVFFGIFDNRVVMSIFRLCYCIMILLGFRYLASSIPIICFAGVAFGVGLVFASLILSLSRNPSILNSLVR